MTEQEAIKEFEERLAIADFRDDIPEYYEAMELAVKDMKEVQQYRAIGTPEECRAAVEKQKTSYDVEKIAEKLEDYLFEKYCVEGDSKIYEIVKGGGVDAN